MRVTISCEGYSRRVMVLGCNPTDLKRARIRLAEREKDRNSEMRSSVKDVAFANVTSARKTSTGVAVVGEVS